MKMKDNTRVSEYLVNFNSHAPYTGWNTVALAGHFYRGLPDRIKDMFQYLLQKPQTFEEVRFHALEFDQRYWERQEEMGNHPSSGRNPEKGKQIAQSPRTNPHSHQQGQQNPRNPPNANPAPPTASSPTSPTSPTASSRKPSNPRITSPTTNTQPRGPLTKEEKDRRRAEGLCLYCGEPGHNFGACPRLPNNRKPLGRAVFTFSTTEADPDSENVLPAQEAEETS